MSTKFTPGPWECSGTAVYAESGREIVFHAHNTRSGALEERTANAHLIASSPALYAALARYIAQDECAEPNVYVINGVATDVGCGECDFCVGKAALDLAAGGAK